MLRAGSQCSILQTPLNFTRADSAADNSLTTSEILMGASLLFFYELKSKIKLACHESIALSSPHHTNCSWLLTPPTGQRGLAHYLNDHHSGWYDPKIDVINLARSDHEEPAALATHFTCRRVDASTQQQGRCCLERQTSFDSLFGLQLIAAAAAKISGLADWLFLKR